MSTCKIGRKGPSAELIWLVKLKTRMAIFLPRSYSVCSVEIRTPIVLYGPRVRPVPDPR
jgi:hypothetical protein